MIFFTEAQKQFCSRVKDFALKELAPGAKERAKLDYITPEVFKKLADEGFLRLNTPPHCGGASKDSVTIGIVFEEICKVDFSAMIVLLNQILMNWMMGWISEGERRMATAFWKG
jgi:alkylation response protein AidB-like acyl-CoA dehydrogenase